MQRSFIRMIALCAAANASFAHAQSAPPAVAGGDPGRQGDSVTIGLGVGVTAAYDGARDYKLIPGGVVRGTISGHDFQLNGPQLFVDAIPNTARGKLDFEFGPVVGARFNRTGTVSDVRVAALGQLDTAIELGAHGAVGVRGVLNRTDKLALAVTSVWDVAGAHRSHVISPSLEYSTVLARRTFVRMALSGDFVGKGYAAYYFGISPAGAAASGLSAYAPDGGLASIGGTMVLSHSLGRGRSGWGLFGIAGYTRLLGAAAASPIVRDTGSPNQLFSALGLAYTF